MTRTLKPMSGGRKLKRALFASLALNLVLVGLMGGAALRHHPFEGGRGGGHLMRELASILPEDRLREVRRVYRRAGADDDDGEERLAAVLAARRGIADALETKPFDNAALTAAIQAMRVKFKRMRAVTKQGFLDVAAALTNEERGKLAEALRNESRVRARWERRFGGKRS